MALTSTTVVIKICTARGQPAINDLKQQGVSCHACFNFSRLCSGSPTLHSGNSPSPTECMSSVFIILKFNRAHLGIWPQASKQASKQADIHTHVCNAVLLVWGSLRLSPTLVAITKSAFQRLHHCYWILYAPYTEQDQRQSQPRDGASEPKMIRRKRRPYCQRCTGCLQKEDCGSCSVCK